MKELEKHGKGARVAGYIVTIVIQFIFIWVVQRLPHWVSFLTDSYSAVMWLLIISALANVVANTLWIFYDGKSFKSAIQFLLNAFAFVVTYTTYVIFPFRFSNGSNWPHTARIILILCMIGIAIGALVEFIKIFSPEKKVNG